MITFVPVTVLDTGQITEWVKSDPEHDGRVSPDFWLNPPADVQVWAVEDEQGVLFYVRAENILRLHIQFPPERSKRLVRGISEFSAQMKVIAGARSYKQLIFDSISKTLIRFLEKRGFKHSPNEYVSTTVEREPISEDTPPDVAGQGTV